MDIARAGARYCSARGAANVSSVPEWGSAICENGHVIGTYLRAGAEVDKFCENCYAPILLECPSCHTVLRGAAPMSGDVKRPNGCRECGQPYPWTTARGRAHQK
jgi:hypothetical protein